MKWSAAILFEYDAGLKSVESSFREGELVENVSGYASQQPSRIRFCISRHQYPEKVSSVRSWLNRGTRPGRCMESAGFFR